MGLFYFFYVYVFAAVIVILDLVRAIHPPLTGAG